MTVCSEAAGEPGSARLARCVGVLLFFLPAVKEHLGLGRSVIFSIS